MITIFKRRQSLIIALVVILFVCFIGGAMYFVTHSTPQKTLASTSVTIASSTAVSPTFSTPEEALNAYCNALKNNDAQALYEMQPNSQHKLSIPEIQNSFKLAKKAGGLTSCTFQSLQENGSNASAVVTIAYKDGANAAIRFSLQQKDATGSWQFTDSKKIAS